MADVVEKRRSSRKFAADEALVGYPKMGNDFVVEDRPSECGKSGDLAFVTIFPKAKRTGDGLPWDAPGYVPPDRPPGSKPR